MKKRIFHFPQFQRTIPASIKTILKNISSRMAKLIRKYFFAFTIFIIFLLTMLNAVYPLTTDKSEEQILASELIAYPDNPLLHEKLGEKYITYNIYAAKREFALAEKLTRFDQIKRYDTDLAEEYKYWEDLHTLHPDYDFSLLKLSEILIFQNNHEKADESLKKVLERNPFDATGLQLKNKLER